MDQPDETPDRTGAHGPLGELVRERRIAMGLTQRQAARRAGVSLATWQSVERPSSAPERFTELTLSRVASGLRLSTDTVFATAGRAAPSTEVPSGAVRDPVDADDVEARITEITEQLRVVAANSPADLLLLSGIVRELTERFIHGPHD